MQITPESLESLLINKYSQLNRLFGELKFIIIDEVHAFMSSERGGQILCQLTRLSKFISIPPRRIGLSATLGDYTSAAKWLQAETNREVITSDIQNGQRKLHLAVEHFYTPDKEEESHTNPYYQYIFERTKSRNCLIFANNRAETELVISNLRQIATSVGFPDIYHVHHGSISTKLRQDAESAMRDSASAPGYGLRTSSAVTAATVTLELGIDIGQLERVMQLGAPISVSSFLQRLGRSGRRGEPSEMGFVCTEKELSGESTLPYQIPWQLLQAIAIIQLYLEERWIEPIRPLQYPMSLLYHQTMSILAAMGELSPAALAAQVLKLPSFTAISTDDFRLLLNHLLEIDHLQQIEKGNLIIGVKGEKIVNSFQFYAVFTDNKEYKVRDESMEIGSIIMPPPGNRFTLAGRNWEIFDIEPKANTIWVKPVEGIANIAWRGGSSNIHTKILQKMQQVLAEDTEYSYLQSGAKKRLKTARQLAKTTGINQFNVLQIKSNICCILPWMGTAAYRTFERLLNLYCRDTLEIKSITGVSPYFMLLKVSKDKIDDTFNQIYSLCTQQIAPQQLVSSKEVLKLQKYDRFIPTPLLHRAFALDYLDTKELQTIVRSWQTKT